MVKSKLLKIITNSLKTNPLKILTSVGVLAMPISADAYDEWKDTNDRTHFKIYQDDLTGPSGTGTVYLGRFFGSPTISPRIPGAVIHIGEDLDLDHGLANLPKGTEIEGDNKKIKYESSYLFRLSEDNIVKDLNIEAGQFFIPTIAIDAEETSNYQIVNCSFYGADNPNSCGISTSEEVIQKDLTSVRRRISGNFVQNWAYGIQSLNSADEIYDNTFLNNTVSIRQRTLPIPTFNKSLDEKVMNLGTEEVAGNNKFLKSIEYDVVNLSEKPIKAYGNTWDGEPKVKGNVKTGYAEKNDAPIENPCPMSIVGIDSTRTRKLRDTALKSKFGVSVVRAYHTRR